MIGIKGSRMGGTAGKASEKQQFKRLQPTKLRISGLYLKRLQHTTQTQDPVGAISADRLQLGEQGIGARGMIHASCPAQGSKFTCYPPQAGQAHQQPLDKSH